MLQFLKMLYQRILSKENIMTYINITNANCEIKQKLSATFYSYKPFNNSMRFALELINIRDEEDKLIQRQAFFEMISSDQFKKLIGELIIGQLVYFSAEIEPNEDLEDSYIFTNVEFDIEKTLKEKQLIIEVK
jgi:hypothetical protein